MAKYKALVAFTIPEVTAVPAVEVAVDQEIELSAEQVAALPEATVTPVEEAPAPGSESNSGNSSAGGVE